MPTHGQTQNNPTALLLGTTPRETVGGSREGFPVECLQEARWTNLKQEHCKERHRHRQGPELEVPGRTTEEAHAEDPKNQGSGWGRKANL